MTNVRSQLLQFWSCAGNRCFLVAVETVLISLLQAQGSNRQTSTTKLVEYSTFPACALTHKYKAGRRYNNFSDPLFVTF
ncbi:hypothetical protein DFS33DRAFT_424897 [Desarmillaria ectypa]|nr:hypothetical protein DFS33DRAFT_424897 [Desarmillaria ectypa]